MIYTRIDQFMIASMLGVEDVAKFSVAVRISDAYMFIPMAISVSFCLWFHATLLVKIYKNISI